MGKQENYGRTWFRKYFNASGRVELAPLPKQDRSLWMTEMRLRRSGRTTRLIDAYIQELFDRPNQWIEIRDHYQDEVPAGNIIASYWLISKIRERVNREHNLELRLDDRRMALMLETNF